MPAGQVGELRSYFYVCHTTADVDCDQRGDVCDRETVASDKLLSVQLAIHPFESLMDDRTLRFAVVRELLETTLKDRARILNCASDSGEQLQFHPPVPHLDLRLLAQVAPEQVWLGMKPLQDSGRSRPTQRDMTRRRAPAPALRRTSSLRVIRACGFDQRECRYLAAQARFPFPPRRCGPGADLEPGHDCKAS